MSWCSDSHKLIEGEEYTEIIEDYFCKIHAIEFLLSEFHFQCKVCGCWWMEKEEAIEGCDVHDCEKCRLKKLVKNTIKADIKRIKWDKW